MRFQKIGLTTVVLCTVGIQQSFSIDIVTKEKPNIVFILADDLGWTDLGVLGSVIVKGQSKRHASASDTYFTNITVDEGDTLWSIAQANIDYDYYDSIYDYMEQLKDINNLTTDDINAGDNMIVIYYADSVH